MKKNTKKQISKIVAFLAFFTFIGGNLPLAIVLTAFLIALNWEEVQYFLQKQGVQVNVPKSQGIPTPNIPKPNFSSIKSAMPKPNKKIIFLILVVIGAIWVASSSYVIIKHGTVGVVTRFGKVTGQVYEPGLHFMVPMVDKVVTYNTKKIIYETSDTPLTSMADYTDYPVDTTTKDGQQITVRYSVRFSVDPEKVTWIANNLGNEVEIVEKVVKADSRIHTRNVPKQYPASDLYTGNVEDVINMVGEKLTPIFEENGLLLDEFGIRSISFTPEYVDAIESKQIEAEKVITEQNRAEQEKYKKEASITKAQGEAEAQRLQQETLTTQLLQKLWIEKWDGQLPTYQGGGTPLIQLPE